ncbi:NADP-dependent D-sorbitol-6-phosphate dehydrogenase [Tanacetum coccineum]
MKKMCLDRPGGILAIGSRAPEVYKRVGWIGGEGTCLRFVKVMDQSSHGSSVPSESLHSVIKDSMEKKLEDDCCNYFRGIDYFPSDLQIWRLLLNYKEAILLQNALFETKKGCADSLRLFESHWLLGFRFGYPLKADYQNETEVGEALAEAFKTGLVKREDLFITTKINSNQISLDLSRLATTLNSLAAEQNAA